MSTQDLEQSPANGAVEAEPVEERVFDKARWLSGPSDIEEDEIYVESLETWCKVRGLTAGQQATIQDRCLVMRGDLMKLDTQQMAVYKFAAGVSQPKFSEEEANVLAHRLGPSFSLVVSVIDELSKASEEDVAKARARFRPRR